MITNKEQMLKGLAFKMGKLEFIISLEQSQ